MAIERIDAELCNGCGVCLNTCCMDVFRLDDTQKKAYIKYAEDCINCFSCEADCPTGAIYISTEPTSAYLLSWG